MHWKSLHLSVSLQPFFSSIIRYILQRLVCLYLLQSTSIFIWFIGKRICSRSISSMVQCLQNKMMHFNILIKFPINSYLSKAWNLYGREWKKNRQKSYVILDSSKMEMASFVFWRDWNKQKLFLSLWSKLFWCLEYGIVEKKNNSKKFMADRHWRTFQEFIQMRRANAWNLFAMFVFCWSHFSLRPNLILTQSNIPTCCYYCWDMQETHFTTLPVTFATSLSSLCFFSFCFCEIFICNFEYRSMLFR